MMRYIRAFFIALKMTLRGESLPPRQYEPLWQWIESGQQHIKVIQKMLVSAGLTEAQRKSMTLHIEGRDVSVQSILGALTHHFETEYPYLLRDLTHHSITGIYATNMNDQFLVGRLAQADQLTQEPLQDAIMRLVEHLNAIPPSTSL